MRFNPSCVWLMGPRVLQIKQAIVIVLGCPPVLDSKVLFVKTPSTCNKEHEEIKLALMDHSLPYGRAFIAMKLTVQSSEKVGYQQCYPSVHPVSNNDDLPEKICP